MILETVVLPLAIHVVSAVGKAGTGQIVAQHQPRIFLLHRTMVVLSFVATAAVPGTITLSATCPESGTMHPLSTKGLRSLLQCMGVPHRRDRSTSWP